MAEEAQKREDWIAEVVIWAVLLLILFRSLGGFFDVIERNFGIDTSPVRFFETTRPLTESTPLGSIVVAKGNVDMYDGPGGSVIGAQSDGALGKVVGGPVLRDGALWWQVQFEDGTVAWMHEDDIAIDIAKDRKALHDGDPPGTRVLATKDIDLVSNPDGGVVTGVVREGAEGKIVEGPRTVNGERWWRVQFDDGTTGWVREDDMAIDIARNLRALHEDTELGTRVVNILETEVFDRPNGNILGKQVKKARGILEGGPAFIGINRWWFINYTNGVDGWVPEEVLEKHIPFYRAVVFTGSAFLFVSKLISLIFLIGIVYVFLRLPQVVKVEQAKFGVLDSVQQEGYQVPLKNHRWEKIMTDVESLNPNDWRLAVLEADILLDDMVSRMGYIGDTLGEKLQKIERSDFLTLDKAWEAHKIRNILAHEGSDFILTQREAKRIISFYEDVFKEFHLI